MRTEKEIRDLLEKCDEVNYGALSSGPCPLYPEPRYDGDERIASQRTTDNLLYIVDEALGVPDAIYLAIEEWVENIASGTAKMKD